MIGQERVRGQRGGLVGERVDDLRSGIVGRGYWRPRTAIHGAAVLAARPHAAVGSVARLSHPLPRVRRCDEIDERVGRGGLQSAQRKRATSTSALRRVPAREPRRQRLLRPVHRPHAERRRHRRAARAWSTRSTSATPARWTACGPSSVALVVTSPPYFAGKAYEAELGEGHIPATYVEYLTMLEDVFAECVAKLEPGGRIAVNVANLGRKPYRSLSADVIGILQDRLGLLLRGEVVWRKARGAGGNCAWGSFKQPANPVLRDLTERVVIASKGRFDRARQGPGARAATGLPVRGHHHGRRVHGRHARRVGAGPRERHPGRPPGAVPGGAAPAPHRPLHLRGRRRARPVHGLGHHRRGRRAHRPPLPRLRHRRGLRPGRSRAGRRRGRARAATRRRARPDKAAAAAQELLAAAGFTVADAEGQQAAPVRRRAPGVDWIATDAAGGEWLVLVAGASTVHRSGLRRSDVLFRTLGEAAVLTTAGHRVLVLTTDLPGPRLVGARRPARPRAACRSSTRSSSAPPAWPSGWPPTPPAASRPRSGELLPGRVTRAADAVRQDRDHRDRHRPGHHAARPTLGDGAGGAPGRQRRRRRSGSGSSTLERGRAAPPGVPRRVGQRPGLPPPPTACGAARRAWWSGRAPPRRRATRWCRPTSASTTCG